jgi:hypothetical protein
VDAQLEAQDVPNKQRIAITKRLTHEAFNAEPADVKEALLAEIEEGIGEKACEDRETVTVKSMAE